MPGKPLTPNQVRELQRLVAEGDRLLRLLGEDPDEPVDLTAIIVQGHAALGAVLTSERHVENLRRLQHIIAKGRAVDP